MANGLIVHEHLSYPGYGWVEPLMDQDMPLMTLNQCERVAGLELDAAQQAIDEFYLCLVTSEEESKNG